MTFLSQVSVAYDSKPFDLTFLMTNPELNVNTEGWSENATVNFSCAEFYQKTFDFNQTLEGLPAGTYKVSAQAFQRPGTSTDSYNDYSNGNNKVNAVLYAGSNEKKICHIAEGAQTRSIGGTESNVGGKYFPNNMEAASLYFKQNLYQNELVFTTAQNGDLKIGLKSPQMDSNYWVIFDNFHFYSFGQVETAVKGIKVNNSNSEQKIFTLDGRRLTNNYKLKPGIYVINGKKTIVK